MFSTSSNLVSHFSGLVALRDVLAWAIETTAMVAAPKPRIALLRGGDDISDAELVERARGGDGWALESLYRRHVQLVGGIARRMLRDRSEVEDVVQETFLLAFEGLAKLDDAAAFRGWLARIALSRVHRRFRWRKVLTLFGGADDEGGSPLELEASSELSPEQRAELAKIDEVLRRLAMPLREAWTLRIVMGCTNDEVATACGCSLATAKRRIADADRAVRTHVFGAVADSLLPAAEVDDD